MELSLLSALSEERSECCMTTCVLPLSPSLLFSPTLLPPHLSLSLPPFFSLPSSLPLLPPSFSPLSLPPFFPLPSLLPFPPHLSLSPPQDIEDHCVLLCSLLLGYGLEAYVCVGTKAHGLAHSWVATIGSEGHTTFWESLTGQRYCSAQ